ncbi:major facilitator superfamily domain-containing protein [Lipomyces kononenkoae]|uniref:Major facilitator superfamily domain-containing protein n=1 Tax=Lipomyces kononenkoae TaxID=34357 RepID=A0ACC3T2G7_LIPKO
MGPRGGVMVEHEGLPPSVSNHSNTVTLASSDDSIVGDDQNSKWWKLRPSIYLLLPALLVLTIAEGALIAPSLNVLFSLVCRAHYMQPDEVQAKDDIDRDCQTAEVHATVSRFTMIILLLQGLMSALVSPKLGALSDRFGRRPILAIAAIGPVFSSTILVAAIKSTSPHAYIWMLLLPILPGLTGSWATVRLTANAYATDCTPPLKRAYVFGLFQACLLLGQAIGPGLGGLVIQYTGDLVSGIYLALVMQIAFGLFVFFILPESLSQEKIVDAQEVLRIASEFAAAEPRDLRYYVRHVNILKPLKELWPTDGTRLVIKKNILALTAISTIFHGTGIGVIVSLLLYAEYIFHWTTAETGFFISLTSMSRVISLLVVLPAITYFYKRRHGHAQHEVGASKSDIFIIKIALVGEIASYLLMASATNGIEFALGGTLGAFGILESPIIKSAITKHVPAEKTGAVLGAVSLVESLSEVLAPIVFSNIYASTVGYYPKAIFVATMLVLMIAFVLTLFVTEHLGGGLYDSGDGLDVVDGRHYTDQDPTIELDSQNGSNTEER